MPHESQGPEAAPPTLLAWAYSRSPMLTTISCAVQSGHAKMPCDGTTAHMCSLQFRRVDTTSKPQACGGDQLTAAGHLQHEEARLLECSCLSGFRLVGKNGLLLSTDGNEPERGSHKSGNPTQLAAHILHSTPCLVEQEWITQAPLPLLQNGPDAQLRA